MAEGLQASSELERRESGEQEERVWRWSWLWVCSTASFHLSPVLQHRGSRVTDNILAQVSHPSLK